MFLNRYRVRREAVFLYTLSKKGYHIIQEKPKILESETVWRYYEIRTDCNGDLRA